MYTVDSVKPKSHVANGSPAEGTSNKLKIIMPTLKLLPKSEHWYESPKKKGVYYPSVTYVTGFLPKGQFFEKYLAEQDSWESSRELLKEAGERGTRVHIASELLDRGESICYEPTALTFTDEEYQLLYFYTLWHKKYKPVIALDKIELRLISDKLKLGGTADRVYQIDGKTVLFDLKTSKSAIWDSHWIQTSCYASMYEELYKVKVDEVAILRLTSRRKEGYEYVTRSRDKWKNDFKQFKKTYDTMIYLSNNKIVTPKIIEIPDTLTLNEKDKTDSE